MATYGHRGMVATSQPMAAQAGMKMLKRAGNAVDAAIVIAAALPAIAESRAEAFYRGELAERFDAFMQRYEGFLRFSDLAAYAPEWVEPVG